MCRLALQRCLWSIEWQKLLEEQDSYCTSTFYGKKLFFFSEFGGGGAYIRVLLCGFFLSFFEFLVLYCVAFFSFFF